MISPRICETTRLQHFNYTYAATTTTNSYVALDTIDLRGRMNCAIRVNDTHTTNSIDYKILGSVDGTTFDITVQGEATITGTNSATVNKSSTVYIPYIKIYIKSTVAATHGTVTATFACM
jgi:hypothetical protein